MSLNFQFHNITDTNEGMQFVWPEYDAVSNPNVPMNPKVESIIFATMSTGINKLTEDNVPKFYSRYLMLIRTAGYDAYFSLEDAYKMVGLTTNASSYTDAAFKKHLMGIFEREINWKVSREMKALNDADKLDEMGGK